MKIPTPTPLQLQVANLSDRIRKLEAGEIRLVRRIALLEEALAIKNSAEQLPGQQQPFDPNDLPDAA